MTAVDGGGFRSLGDQVAPLRPAGTLGTRSSDALRAMVLQGVLVPGQRLNEVELAAALGISRGPLREAIRSLASEGLLTIVSHKGAFVRSFRAEDLRELYEVRIGLEAHAARLASGKASSEELAELGSLLDRTEAALDESPGVGYPEEMDFHRRILTLVGNGRLLELTTSIHQQIELARLRSAQVPDRARTSLTEHREIAACLGKRDGEKAAKLMAEHLEHSLANAMRLFDLAAE